MRNWPPPPAFLPAWRFQPGRDGGAGRALGLAGIGIADRNTVAGVVRAHVALKDLRESHAAPEGFRLVVGARLVFADGTPDMLAYPQTRLGWGRLTSLLTRGNLRAVKGDCILHLADLVAHLDGMQIVVLPPDRFPTALPTSPCPIAVPEPHRAPVDYTPAVTRAGARAGAGAGRAAGGPAGASAGRGAGARMAGRDDAPARRRCAAAGPPAGHCGRARVPVLAVNDALFARRCDKPCRM
jgi:error-prone DNA polymerase